MLEVRTVLVGLLGATLIGCTSEARSCDLETDEILMWATVTDLGDTVEVEVEFEAEGAEGAALALCPERDQLLVNGIEAGQVRALGHVYYVGELEPDVASSVEIMLKRSDADSVSVVVDMPPPLDILTPEPNTSHSRSGGLEVTWAPDWTGNLIELAIEDTIGSECLNELGVMQEVDDIGSYTLGGNSLVSGVSGGDCEVTLALTRRMAVDYPDELHEGGAVAGFVRRRQPFTSID